MSAKIIIFRDHYRHLAELKQKLVSEKVVPLGTYRRLLGMQQEVVKLIRHELERA